MAEKKLRVQINVCKRLQKEVASYEREVVTNEARVQKMRDEGRDVYDIRKQEEVLQESYMMIPDSKKRLETALEELSNNLEECRESGIDNPTLFEEASALIPV